MDDLNSCFRAKRPFSEVEDADDFVPISKRINNLNIQGPRNSQDEQSASLQPEIGAAGVVRHDLLENSSLLQNQVMRYQNPHGFPQGHVTTEPMPALHIVCDGLPSSPAFNHQTMDQSIAHHPHWFPAKSGQDHQPSAMYPWYTAHHQAAATNSSNHALDLTNHHHLADFNERAIDLRISSSHFLSPGVSHSRALPLAPSLPLTPPLDDHSCCPPTYHQSQASASAGGRLVQENPSSLLDSAGSPECEELMRMDGEYDPELGETDNPHYYHINRVLFKAHCERMRREGDSLNRDFPPCPGQWG